MNKRNFDIAYFLSFCIEQYKEAKHLTGAEAVRILSQSGVLDYLEQHYEPLHTQSRQWLMKEIDDYVAKEKGRAA